MDEKQRSFERRFWMVGYRCSNQIPTGCETRWLKGFGRYPKRKLENLEAFEQEVKNLDGGKKP